MGMAQGSKKGRMMRNFVHSTVFGLGLALAMPAHAQQASDQTLADIRQELTVLYVELQRLQRELSTTGAPSTSVTGQTTLARLDAIEAELQRLTAKTERLEFRVGSVVRDGTSRIGDLEFRLCELEPACDIANLGETPLLGGVPAADAAPAAAPAAPAPTAPVTELAIGEQADFDRARALLGKPFHISGHVIHGQKLGRDIGYPTLNVRVPEHCAARSGVYVVRVHGLTGQALPGIASLGVRPTVIDQGRLLLEVHLLDQRLDAYGKLARIEFLEFVRDEEKFPDLITMIAAIDNDAQRARDYFASNGL